MKARFSLFFVACFALALLPCITLAGEPARTKTPKASPVPSFQPRRVPVVTGEFIVGVITITFKETEMNGEIGALIRNLERVKDTHLEAGHGSAGGSSDEASIVNQDEYFKIFSNGIAWPKLVMMPNEALVYRDEHFYGYYCEYDTWTNPLGWKEEKEGMERVAKMNQHALRHADKTYRGPKPHFLCYNYVTTRPETPAREIREELLPYYQGEVGDERKRRSKRTRRARRGDPEVLDDFGPWLYYAPVCKWGQPMWPNSKIQINDFAGGVFAHEVGHCLGAPDAYHAPRFSDGIMGAPCLKAYGPTSHAFSRYYHHAYIKEGNHPTIKTSGTYTLHPRHIKPEGDQAVGYLIPSNHPHYVYQVEYVQEENSSVGIGPRSNGMLITVLNLGLTSYLGSPDYAYVYRPNDPFFRGKGDVENCFFGKAHGRTTFDMRTEPSSRLPNLLDGGISLRNIEEKGSTMTFDVVIDRKPVTGSAYALSMLPQIRLDAVTDVQATSFTMDCTIKFRGEPLKTIYGFCWATSRNPTVRNSTFILAHREWYRGHAINLTPNTTYYVRAFATNGLGVRYSDEEQIVKTADVNAPPASIGPLLTDAFSDNVYLFNRYSIASSGDFLHYSTVCTLAKLAAYYRPERFPSAPTEGSKATEVDFNQLSWNPGEEDKPTRLLEVDGFFQSVNQKVRESNLHEMLPSKELSGGITKLMGIRSKPLSSKLARENVEQVAALMRKDLVGSRPVLLVFAPDREDQTENTHWALVDGIDSKGAFHVDFPRNSQFFFNNEMTEMKSGYYPLADLLFPKYQVMVLTSCYFGK